jgi:hypothetical protein
MDLFYEENYQGVLGHLTTKKQYSLHKFSNTSFKKYIDGNCNITISKVIVYITAEEIMKKSPELNKLFYDTPNECESSQYSEFFSAVLYKGLFDATGFISEGNIIKKLRAYHKSMDGISPPDIYMSDMNGKSVLVSVTRFNSLRDRRIRCENLLKNKVIKASSSIYTTNPIYKNGPDRCIIQVFTKSEKNATFLRNTWANIVYIPSNIYLHVVICKHEKIYEDNGFF